MASDTPLDNYLRELVHQVVREVLSEVGQSTPLQLYDPDDAAKILAVPKRWIYERTADNSIPHQKLGKFIRFTEADLRAIAERKKVK